MSDENRESSWLRRLAETGFFVTLVAIMWTLDTLAKLNVRNFGGVGLDDFRLIAEQVTSALAVLMLVPAVAWWLSRFPLRRDRVPSAVVGHVIGSALFAVAHCFLMVLMRFVSYPMFGREYLFSDFWFRNLVLEYQKDLKIYIATVAIIAVYRHLRKEQPNPFQNAPDRLIVQTGSGEKIIRHSDIEYLEAARNYVVVGTGDREYLLRDTLKNLEQALRASHIVRTHRSWLVNIDKIDEIRSNESGGDEIRLQGGKRVPLSRGYKNQFKSTVAG